MERALALALTLAASSCFLGGQTGQENSSMREADPCRNAGTRPIGLDEETPLGWRPRDIVDETAATEERPLEWYWPESGSTQVRISFRLDLDSARLRESSECTGRVEIDSVVTLHTTDGKLRDEFVGALEVTSAKDASFSGAIPVDALQGTLDAGKGLDPKLFANPKLRLQIWVTAGDVRGQLSLDGRDANPNDDTSPTSPAVGAF